MINGKKLNLDAKNAIMDSKRLANNGNYQDAIRKLEECKRNLSVDFKELCQKTDFNAIDNVLSMLKYFALPIALALASISIHYGYQKHYLNKDVVRSKVLQELIDLPPISVLPFDVETNINMAKQNVFNDIMNIVKKFDNVVKVLAGFGCSITVIKSIIYFSNIFKVIKSKKGNLAKMGNACYNMAYMMYNNMMASIDDLEKYYKRKTEE